jgi:hypothetical protein
MGDRFYQQQLDRRKRPMPWEEEQKSKAVSLYVEQEPTPDTSMEIVKDIADQLNESANGVRMILTRAGVYVKKTPAKRASNGSTGGGRVSVADAQQSLKNALTDAGMEPDDSIISKLTGKAANYFADILNKVNK